METEQQKESINNNQDKGLSLKEIVKLLVITFILVMPIRIFIAEPYLVKGLSMDPTFKNNDYLIVEKITSRMGNIERGDIIVFKSPLAEKRNLIKRVIGLPGEKIALKDGKFTIEKNDGAKVTLEESYVIYQNIFKENNWTLKPDEYFVSGDNRAGSYDSRDWGPLKKEKITGKPLIRLFHFNSVGLWPGKFSI